MSAPFNEHWLEMGACVPVDIETTAILLKEIKQLRHDALLEKQWKGLTDEEIKATWSQLWYDLNHGKLSAPDAEVRNNVVVFGQALEAMLKEQNT